MNKARRRHLRHNRVRTKVKGTQAVPRLTVFRSAKHIYAQIIDDGQEKTLAAFSDLKMPKSQRGTEKENVNIKAKIAFAVGENVAKKALAKKITKVVFDRGGYKFHGRIKSLAEGAKKGGLVF